ncbi:hypothetical protein ALUC_40813A [Aspergillus luchuensis]|nr:hypothetical protein ALUC_40813A [Aspergillus luchuensis]
MLLCQLNGRIQKRDSSQLNEVQLRLVHCNLKRRNRFLYSQRHAMGLDAGNVRRTPVPKPAGSAQKETPQEKPGWESLNNSPIHANNTVITGTSASRLSDGFQLPQPGHTLHQIDHAKSVTLSAVSNTALEVDYPRPPQLKDDARLFRCPCCCEALPAKMTDDIRWRKHIEDDLSPYTCVLASCDQPYVLFNTKDSWRQHMLKDHNSMTYWTCFACCDGKKFSRRKDFVQHTKFFHAATVPLAHIPVLDELSKKTIPSEIRHCPLCNWPEADEVGVEKEALFNHIAKEVHSFSLRALPWADDNGQESDNNIHNCSEKVYDWLIKNSIQAYPSIERPPREERLWYDGYFQKNAYFACSSESSSSFEFDFDRSRQMDLDELRKMNEIESPGQNSEVNANPALHSSTSKPQGYDGKRVEDLEIPMESRRIKLSEEHSDTKHTPLDASSDIFVQNEKDLPSAPAYFWGPSSDTRTAALIFLDTNASADIMSHKFAKELDVPLKPWPNVLVCTPSTGSAIKSEIEVYWRFTRYEGVYRTKFLVLDMDTDKIKQEIIYGQVTTPTPAIAQTPYGQGPVKVDIEDQDFLERPAKLRSLGATF